MHHFPFGQRVGSHVFKPPRTDEHLRADLQEPGVAFRQTQTEHVMLRGNQSNHIPRHDHRAVGDQDLQNPPGGGAFDMAFLGAR